jgi:hypothetical protein
MLGFKFFFLLKFVVHRHLLGLKITIFFGILARKLYYNFIITLRYFLQPTKLFNIQTPILLPT